MLNIYLNDGRVIDLKKPIIISTVVLVVLIFGTLLYKYLTTGQLVVTTNNPNNQITVTRAYNYNQNIYGNTPVSDKTTSNQTLSLHPGTYSIEVSNATFSTQQIVQIKARHTVRVSINLDKVSALGPVASFPASSVVADNNTLDFINPTTKSFYAYNSQTNNLSINSSPNLTSIQWSSPAFGVGQDASGNFYTIENNVISPLNLSFSYKPNPFTQYAVSPNGEIYIATNTALYKGSITSSFVKIFSIENPVTTIAASNQAVVFFEGKDNDNENSKDSSSSTFYVINQNGNKHQISDGEVTKAAWSKSGKYLAAMVNGQLVIWNNTLNQKAVLPNNGISSLDWLDDNTLFYGLGSGVWSYSVQANKAVLLSQSATGQAVNEVSTSSDSAYLYVSLASQQQPIQTYELARIGLQNQPPSNARTMGTLVVILPNNVNSCSINYLNLNTPDIVIQASGQSQQTCLQTTKTYLNGYNVNTANLSFIFTGGF